MNLSLYKQMISWKRPSGSKEAKLFGDMYLEPVFGSPDEDGNYLKIVGDKPRVSFVAHYDTVHSDGGLQELFIEDDNLYSVGSDCLGADDTTGIFIIMDMIQKGIPGVYVIFSDEEVGCQGSSKMAQKLSAALSEDTYHPLVSVDIMISFDRKGTTDIITHQMGDRTASDEFARDLARELDMDYKADPTGSYTDSNEFSSLISECTNLSVGYYSQHTGMERQDLTHLMDLIDSLLFVDWDKVDAYRTPLSYTEDEDDKELEELEAFVIEHPLAVAEMLQSYRFTIQDIMDETQVASPNYYS